MDQVHKCVEVQDYVLNSYLLVFKGESVPTVPMTHINFNDTRVHFKRYVIIDVEYKAIIYKDGADADWQKNPKSYAIETIEVTSKSKIKLHLANGGGAAISFDCGVGSQTGQPADAISGADAAAGAGGGNQ